MNENLEIFYIHKPTNVVLSLSELREISNYKKIAIKEHYYDETFNQFLEHEYVYNKTDILIGKDWTIVPIMKDLTLEEKEELENNINSIKFYEMLKGFEKKEPERERGLHLWIIAKRN